MDTGEKSEVKHIGKPEEVREFPRGKVELVTLGGATVGRATFLPGWRWSTSVKPIVKTASCEAPHFQYHLSGTLAVRMDDGTEFECKPGTCPCSRRARRLGSRQRTRGGGGLPGAARLRQGALIGARERECRERCWPRDGRWNSGRRSRCRRRRCCSSDFRRSRFRWSLRLILSGRCRARRRSRGTCCAGSPSRARHLVEAHAASFQVAFGFHVFRLLDPAGRFSTSAVRGTSGLSSTAQPSHQRQVTDGTDRSGVCTGYRPAQRNHAGRQAPPALSTLTDHR